MPGSVFFFATGAAMGAKQMDLFEMFENAKLRMERRFKMGEEQEQMLINIVTKTVIVDRLVPPKAMLFWSDTASTDKKLSLVYGGAAPQTVSIHRHALNQLCQKVNVNMNFVNMELDGTPWQRDVLEYVLNAHYHNPDWTDRSGQPQRFLHRLVGNELRGFLSRRFNRHLASAPLLRSFIDQCKASGARPVEASSSPVRSALKYLLPTVFEAFPGEYICMGVEWSNSDFGSGKLKVLQTVWRVNAASASVLDEGLSKAHIGSVIEDSDVEMSDETAQKEVAAQQSAVRDHVTAFLSEATVERLLKAIQVAHDEVIPWSQLLARVSPILGKGGVEWLKEQLDTKGDSIIELPPISHAADGSNVPNRYWAASAISTMAAKVEDPDRRLDLQREAGKLLAAALAS